MAGGRPSHVHESTLELVRLSHRPASLGLPFVLDVDGLGLTRARRKETDQA